MDQVRIIAKAIWQQRFWVLSVLGTCVAVACWYLAADDLQSRFSQRMNDIKGTFKQVQGITNEAFHPNDDVIKGDEIQAAAQSESVYQVWTELYDRQRTEVLSWPEELGEGFIAHMEGRMFLDEIGLEMRGLYRDYIEKRFDGLLDIVKARKDAQGSSRSGARFEESIARRRPNTSEEDDDYLVEWLDQNELEAKLSMDSLPSHKQIWVTQEDLWVYETLLHVISKTNQQRNATRPDNTAVRVIERLQVGQPAVATSIPQGGIYIADATGTPGSSPGIDGGDAVYSMEPGNYSGRPGAQAGPDDATLLADRYLDPNGQPISGENVGAEYRQLPVHMTLTMDLRWLPQVLIECANAPLPVEVKWVRVNPESARAALGNRSSSRESGLPGQSDTEMDSNLATVQIQGVVLIYGEPNKDLLKVPGVETNPEGQLAEVSPATS